MEAGLGSLNWGLFFLGLHFLVPINRLHEGGEEFDDLGSRGAGGGGVDGGGWRWAGGDVRWAFLAVTGMARSRSSAWTGVSLSSVASVVRSLGHSFDLRVLDADLEVGGSFCLRLPTGLVCRDFLLHFEDRVVIEAETSLLDKIATDDSLLQIDLISLGSLHLGQRSDGFVGSREARPLDRVGHRLRFLAFEDQLGIYQLLKALAHGLLDPAQEADVLHILQGQRGFGVDVFLKAHVGWRNSDREEHLAMEDLHAADVLKTLVPRVQDLDLRLLLSDLA